MTPQLVCHPGYVSLFPLLLRLLPADSPSLGHMLAVMADPLQVCYLLGTRLLHVPCLSCVTVCICICVVVMGICVCGCVLICIAFRVCKFPFGFVLGLFLSGFCLCCGIPMCFLCFSDVFPMCVLGCS